MHARSITEAITIADQPSEADLESLPGEGYVGVINLRQDGEPEQPLSTSVEGTKVRALGMDYLHYAVGGAPLNSLGVAEVCEFLNRHAPDKVLVHCRKGSRAAALVLLHQAKAHGWDADDALSRGEDLGLKVEGGLRMMLQQFLATQP